MRLDPKAVSFNLKTKVHSKIKHENIQESFLFLYELLFSSIIKKENRTHQRYLGKKLPVQYLSRFYVLKIFEILFCYHTFI